MQKNNNNFLSQFSLLPQVKKAYLLIISFAVLLMLCYRMTLGVDLSDEAYYLSFLDDWLKNGLENSSSLVIHQTAELFVFPFIKLFVAINHGTTGLALFNRYLYLLVSCIAGYCFFAFYRTHRSVSVSVLAGILIVSFIPFSLPSLSYNTLGMLGMIAALSSYAVFTHRRTTFWMIVSAVSWMISVISYPTMVVVLIMAVVAALFVPEGKIRFQNRIYVAAVVAFQLLGLVLLFSVYGVPLLEKIFSFTNASLQVSGGIGAKLSLAIGFFSANPMFACLSIGSFVIGIFSALCRNKRLCQWITVLAVGLILLLSKMNGPVLFTKSHDFVFLISVAGIAYFFVRWITKGATNGYSARVLFFVSLFAGIVTSFTATNGLINFAIGGFLSATVFLLEVFDIEEDGELPTLVLLSVVIAFFITSSFSFIYGEWPVFSVSDSHRVRHGVFAGLLTTKTKERSIRSTTTFFETLPGDSVVVLGRLPGIYLLTSKRPQALSSWDFGQQNGMPPKLDEAISQFYSSKANRPAVVLTVNDEWTRPPSGASLQLLSNYSHNSHLETDSWTIDAFTR